MTTADAVSLVARVLLLGGTVSARGYTAGPAPDGFRAVDADGDPALGQTQHVPRLVEAPWGLDYEHDWEDDPSPFGAARAFVDAVGPEAASAAARAMLEQRSAA